jgi:hypothetical protein
VGISAKIWPATDDEIRGCLATPARITDLFHHWSMSSREPRIANGHALLHGARPFGSFLRNNVDAGLHEIAGASDPSYAMFAERVRALHAGAPADPLRDLFDRYSCDATNHVQIADVIRAATRTERGLMFCVFEDW